jgi:hypothetical protein
MQNFIYGLWLLIPVTYFLIILWSKLENIGKKKKQKEIADFFNQLYFVIVTVGVSFLLDIYIVDNIAAMDIFSAFPRNMLRFFVLPCTFMVLSKIIGPSKDIRIKDAPNLSARYVK